jgi:lysophospholipase L1-like esterase
MKWLKPKECGLCKAAHASPIKDGGFKINRLPDYWVQKILRKVSGSAQFPAGLYLQFQTDSTRLVIKYGCGSVAGILPQKMAIQVDEYLLEYQVRAGERNEFMLNLHNNIDKLITILLPWGAEFILFGIGIDDKATLTPDHDKRKAICFCGDSITQGFYASNPVSTYPYLVSRGLDMQLINHGFSGLLLPDPALAIYIAKEVQWDILCISLGVNAYLMGARSAAEFEKLYQVFLEIIRLYKPNKPIFCITPIWQKDSDADNILNNKRNSLQDYRNAIQNVALNFQTKDPHLYLINGLLLIDSGDDLSDDGLHPDDSGMKAMAKGILLAFKINGII